LALARFIFETLFVPRSQVFDHFSDSLGLGLLVLLSLHINQGG
jgi:hypothetical protein